MRFINTVTYSRSDYNQIIMFLEKEIIITNFAELLNIKVSLVTI